MSEVRPFTINVADEVLHDLRARLSNTRWPEEAPVGDWSQGVPLSYHRELCDFWATEYDWRQGEATLNQFDQFTTEIDGLDIHFIHQRSPHPNAMPLLISHGWPGSVYEFHKIIEMLVDPTTIGGRPEDAFDVVAPSLPGFGFSAKPTETGWNTIRIAAAFDTLMTRLGYERYVAQGGDWGSAITHAIGANHDDHCAGIHVTLALGARPKLEGDPTPEEQRALDGMAYYRRWDSGYSQQQSTRPQTLGYGLVDSPAGQAAWILEKFWSWTDCDGDPENVLSKTELLDNITIYWVTASAASSARIYWESFGKGPRAGEVTIPVGVAVFPKEIVPPVRAWLEPRFRNIVHWSEHEKGGHFAALEVPEVLANDVMACFRPLR